ncbi:MAG: FAD-dependent oxidoreductase [Sideroxyarcus sp.]
MRSNLVIGAGALGLATAEALLRQGGDVTILERGSVGRESSWAGGGILSPLCPWDYPDEVNRLALRGMGMFGSLAETLHQSTGIDPEYNRCGMLVLPPFDVQAALQWCAAHGVRAEEREGGVLLPDVAQARNPRLLQSLRARVEKLGGRIVEQCEVKEIVSEMGQVSHLSTTQGNFSADAYIVTAGAWSKVLLGEHALKVDIKPIRGQMLLFKYDAPPVQHIVLQKDIYLIPRRDGHLLLGSTREDVGFDKSTTDEVREMLLQRGIELLPSLRGMPVVKHWAGLRPASPGNIPTIGRHPQLANLFINSGHFRYGVTMSPAAVEVLLNTMNGTPQPFDVSPYLWR